MSKIFIHVGLQKTASTYLQNEIFPFIPGLFYLSRPYTQENEAFNSLQYADGTLYDGSLVRNEIKAIRHAAQAKPILISDELFAGYAFWGFANRATIANRLSEVMPEAEIILFIRNQTELIDSLYNQYVKIGWYHKLLGPDFLHKSGTGYQLQDWIEGQRDWTRSRRRFDHQSVFSAELFRYTELLTLYKSLFSKVHVFLYEDFKKDPLSQLERLGSIFQLTVNASPGNREKDVNTGLSKEALKYKILENKITALMGPSDSEFRKKLLKLFAPFVKDQAASERLGYIKERLRDAGVFEDNKRLVELFAEEVPLLSEGYYDEGEL